MTSVLNPITVTEEIEYPFLGLYKDDSDRKIVVLFVEERCGTIVYSEKSDHPLGYVSDTFDMTLFHKYQGDIILAGRDK
jgi:hypothetical protein